MTRSIAFFIKLMTSLSVVMFGMRVSSSVYMTLCRVSKLQISLNLASSLLASFPASSCQDTEFIGQRFKLYFIAQSKNSLAIKMQLTL